MPPRGSSKHRPGFHALVLAIGFIIGGAMQQAARLLFPAGAAKQFLTAGVTPTLGPLAIDLVLIKFTLGPIVLDVSLLSLVGVLVAYLIARSLF
ncbi:MAG TPA: DUF4321 domain-containing protein [Gemmatimonadaceae bacterium]|jgi:hypothetical protein|nr:DUF4321 domain-containing protein [Gemmatimonadaceae bacterium]